MGHCSGLVLGSLKISCTLIIKVRPRNHRHWGKAKEHTKKNRVPDELMAYLCAVDVKLKKIE